MVLASLVLQMALYGFVGAYLTHSIGLPVTMVLILWFFTISIAAHRNSDEFATTAELIIALNSKAPISLLFGIVLGLIYAWALRLVPLLRWELWVVGWRYGVDDDDGRGSHAPVLIYDTRFTVYALAVALGAVSVTFLLGRFEPELSSATSLVIGGLGLLIALVVVLYTLYRWYSSRWPSDWLTLTFALAASFIVATPLLYDFLLDFRPYNQLAFHLGLLIVVALVAAIHIRILSTQLGVSTTQRMLTEDTRAAPSQASTWRIAARWFTLWLIIALIYLTGGIAAEVSGDDLDRVLVVVFITSLILALIGLALGFFWSWYSPGGATSVLRIAQADYVSRVSEFDMSKLAKIGDEVLPVSTGARPARNEHHHHDDEPAPPAVRARRNAPPPAAAKKRNDPLNAMMVGKGQ